MSLSAIDKIDALSTSKSIAQKAVGDYSYMGWGGYIPSGDLPRDEYGAAAAYAVVVEIFTAIAVWENYLDGIVWIIKDRSTGTEIARTDAKEYPLGERGGKWYRAIKAHERNYYYSYFKRQAQSDWLFGNTYNVMLEAERQFRPNSTNYVGLRWLNPLNVTQMVMGGKIERFNYSSMDNEIKGQILPSQMAYHINRANLFDDLQGYSGILAAMDNINLYRNSIRAFKNFFSQGMQLGGVIMPLPEQHWGDREHENARREFERNFKGTQNSGKWAVLARPAQITPFGQEDASSNFTVTKDLRDLIYSAVSVFPQLAGNPSDATFDNAEHIKRQWWQMLANPYARDIGGYNSDVVIPKLEPGANIYVEPDLSPYEIEDPEVISQDFNAGIIDIATAQAKRGYAVDKEIADAVIYNIGGQVMTKAILLQVASRVPASDAQQFAQADKYQAEAENTVSTPTLPGESAPIESDTETSDKLSGEITSHYLTNDNAETKHVHSHLPPLVNPDNASELEELATWRSLYVPHFEEIDAWRKFLLNGKHQKRQFNPTHLKQSVYSWIQQAIEIGDKQGILDAFQRAYSDVIYSTVYPNFEQKALRGDVGDTIQKAIESHDKQVILDTFRLAQERIEKRIKAIQATRLDFENDFDELLSRARAEKMGRVQWASAMRAIMRRYGRKAYIDGMADGGIEDEPSEDDNITINELAASQSQYVTELGNVLYKEDGITDAAADVKAAMWYNKSIDPFYQAGLLSADANGLYEWVFGQTEKHCESCKRLNGQRHRLKGWKANIMPKSEELDCGGWLCDCNLVKVKGRARGTY